MLNCVNSWDKNNFYYLRIIAIQWFIVGGFFGGMVCYIIWGAQFKNENAGLSLGIGNQFPFPKNTSPWPMQIQRDHSFMLGCSQYLGREWMRVSRHVLLKSTMELPPCPAPDAVRPSLKSDPTNNNPTLSDRTYLQNTNSKVRFSKW